MFIRCWGFRVKVYLILCKSPKNLSVRYTYILYTVYPIFNESIKPINYEGKRIFESTSVISYKIIICRIFPVISWVKVGVTAVVANTNDLWEFVGSLGSRLSTLFWFEFAWCCAIVTILHEKIMTVSLFYTLSIMCWKFYWYKLIRCFWKF